MERRSAYKSSPWAKAICVPGIAVLLLVLGTAQVFAGDQDAGSTSPREMYNEGTKKLGEGKLREAEAFLQNAAEAQNERVQVAALYNLGHVRFKQGMEELTNAPDNRAIVASSARANQHAGEAISEADKALAGEDVQAIVTAYLRGRGARKELRTALEAVKRAMETYGAVLGRFRRASGDFKSTRELRPSDTAAQTNSDLVDQWIAQVVDSQKMLAPAQAQMQASRDSLGEKMQQLKEKQPEQSQEPSKTDAQTKQDKQDNGEDTKPATQPKSGQEGDLPQPQMPGQAQMESTRQQLSDRMRQLKQKLPPELQEQLSKDGEDEDEDESEGDKPPKEPKPGQEEGKRDKGSKPPLTPEEAERLLDMLRLDANRRLTLDGFEQMGKPQDRKGRDW